METAVAQLKVASHRVLSGAARPNGYIQKLHSFAVRQFNMKLPLLVIATLLAVGCKDKETTAADDPNAPTRGYRMGFSAFPPRFDDATVMAVINHWSPRADAAIIHVSPPWPALIAGATADSAVRGVVLPLAQIYRAKNLQLVVVIDVTDGLNRTAEAPELRALGRSITEPAIQALYRQFALSIGRLVQPQYLGLAAETNLIRLAAPRTVYDAVVRMTNDAATLLLQNRVASDLFISVQVETAWGRLQGTTQYIGAEDDFRDFSFMRSLGLSSYPYLAFPDPANLPDDYYARIPNGRTLPVLVVEGGWTSGAIGQIRSSPAKQAQYVARHAQLLERANAIAWLQLLYTDIDVSAFPPQPPGSSLALFTQLGLVDTQLRPKAALATWDSLFALRRR
jgi:hypothetical protein